ncbi:MAG: class II aldolase/adducin family protein [Butyrivibrio hungatei]|nr:class II aldolase/adducin family protein [Butyrivibrio hungatei]
MKSRKEDSEFLEEKQHVIDVANELHKKGYLPRTWGSVSCRVDKEIFLITPSGIRYEDMTPDMICLVNLKNLNFMGEYDPSYERGVHAACYRTRKDVEFVALTHQVFASCAGVLGLKRIYTYVEDEDVVIPCVPYAYPGSAKLAGNVAATIKKNRESDSFILSNHGALFMGANSDEVIENIERIEDACDNFLMDVCKTDMYHGVEEGFGSHLEGDEIIYDVEDTPERVKHIHREIYDRRPDVKYIVHNKSDAVMTVSRTATHLRPLLFDFAELVGYSVKIPSNEHGKDGHSYHNIKKNSNAVFALNDGAYCIGETLEDAVAASIVLDKGCIAYLAALRHGEGHPISYLDCIKMNKYYKKVYSRISSDYLEEKYRDERDEFEDDEDDEEEEEIVRRPSRKTSRESSGESARESSRASGRESLRKASRESGRESLRESSREDSRESARDSKRELRRESDRRAKRNIDIDLDLDEDQDDDLDMVSSKVARREAIKKSINNSLRKPEPTRELSKLPKRESFRRTQDDFDEDFEEEEPKRTPKRESFSESIKNLRKNPRTASRKTASDEYEDDFEDELEDDFDNDFNDDEYHDDYEEEYIEGFEEEYDDDFDEGFGDDFEEEFREEFGDEFRADYSKMRSKGKGNSRGLFGDDSSKRTRRR